MPRDVSLSDSKCWNGGHEWVNYFGLSECTVTKAIFPLSFNPHATFGENILHHKLNMNFDAKFNHKFMSGSITEMLLANIIPRLRQYVHCWYFYSSEIIRKSVIIIFFGV